MLELSWFSWIIIAISFVFYKIASITNSYTAKLKQDTDPDSKVLPKELKILTYNIFLRPPLLVNNAHDYKDQRLQEFMKVMGRYDVIGLQEMFSFLNGRRSRLIKEAEKLGFRYYVSCKPVYSFYGWKILLHWNALKMIADGGVMVFSKYPIVETDSLLFEEAIQADSLAAKQLVYAKIQLGPSPSGKGFEYLHFFTTHLQSSYLNNEDNTDNANIRLRQVKKVGKFIKEKLRKHQLQQNDSNSRCYAILTGDLNVDSRCHFDGREGDDSDEYKQMIRTLLDEDYDYDRDPHPKNVNRKGVYNGDDDDYRRNDGDGDYRDRDYDDIDRSDDGIAIIDCLKRE